ncbi:MAG: hypothetical protein K8R21_03330 [Leptospira sp.]|nr:hypothetical protein [Leptospira sp.]
MKVIIRILILTAVILNFTFCKIWKAHSTNKKGISEFNAGHLKESGYQFEKSMSYGFRSEIPEFNSGNIYMKEKDFSSAHRIYEKLILNDPDFSEALYNDGEALYYWGIAEIDEQNCTTDVTKKLWEAAAERMIETKRSIFWNQELKNRSIENHQLITKKLQELENFPEKCKQNKKDSDKDQSDPDQNKEGKPEEKENKEKKQADPSAVKDNAPAKNENQTEKKNNPAKETEGRDKKKRPKFDPGEKKESKTKTGKESGPLSAGEKENLKSETERVKKQAKGKTHNRSKAQQEKNTKPGETEKVLKEALW